MNRRKFLKCMGMVFGGIWGGVAYPFINFIRATFVYESPSTHVFYVDSINGNDRNVGTSPADAWKTVGKVNQVTFEAGDHILFKRGQVFHSNFLSPIAAGQPRLPITFSAYGTGPRPIITNSMELRYFRENSKNIWSVSVRGRVRKGFEVRIVRNRQTGQIFRGRRYDLTQVKTSGDFFYDKSRFRLYIFSENDPLDHIEVPRGYKYDVILMVNQAWLKFQGLHFDFANQFCLQVRASHLVIRDCHISHGADGGVHTIGEHVDDCKFEDNVIYGCGGSGIMVNGPNVTRDQWVIRNNNVHHNCLDFISGRKGMHNYTAGIKVFCLGSGKDLMIERNHVHHNGNVKQQNPGLSKGVGIWVDTWPNEGAIVRYNRVVQNVNAGIKIELTERQRIYCNIVSENGTGKQWTNPNTGRGGILCSRGAHANLICHNTIVNNFGAQIALQGPLTDIGGRNTEFSNHNIIKNNIAFSFNTEGEVLKVFGWKLGDFNRNVISHNCFGPPRNGFIIWGVQPKPQKFHTYEVFEKTYLRDTQRSYIHASPHIPEFVDRSHGDFHLRPESKLISKGQYIQWISHDFDGVPFKTTPSIGAYQ